MKYQFTGVLYVDTVFSPVLGINTIAYVLKLCSIKLCSIERKFCKVMTITWTVPWNRCYLKEGLLKTPKNECS